MRDIEKDLMEIECTKKKQEKEGDAFASSMLQRCHKLVSELKQYRESEEQGKLLSLPCKIGGTVYVIMNQRDNFSDALYKIVTAAFFRYDMIKDVGKTVFLTREEAEEALENLSGL